MARVDSIQKPTTLLTLKKSKELATETATTQGGQIMLITDDTGFVQGDIRFTSGRPYHTTPFVQVGSIIYYAGNTVPDGYLPCDGSFISQKLYPELFDKIKNYWWKRPFQPDNIMALTGAENLNNYVEVYFMGNGSFCNTGVKNRLKNRWKILIVDNQDHPAGSQYNVAGEIFRELDQNNPREFYYNKLNYTEWLPYQTSAQKNPYLDTVSGVNTYNFNGSSTINREPLFPLPDFSTLFTADQTVRDDLQGYFVRNLNESFNEANPDYYKTEYDDRGLWKWAYESSGWKPGILTEFHLVNRTYSSLQENEIRRHRHQTTSTNSSVSGKHRHAFHGSQGSTNGDPLGKKSGGIANRSDTFGRRPSSIGIKTKESGYHMHMGFVGFGRSVEHDDHKTYIDLNDPRTVNQSETRPWSYSVQFCVKY